VTTGATITSPGPAGTAPTALLAAVLLLTMTASSFQIFALAVLAVDIVDDLSLSLAGLGLLGSANTLVGAVTAPVTGRITDRIGARTATVLVLAVAGGGTAVAAQSAGVAGLAVASLITGVAQGWGNPVTNSLIAERVPATAQGTVMGVKQSGVQFGLFLAGLTLPALAAVWGWRGALWVYAGLFGVLGVAVLATLRPVETTVGTTPGTDAERAAPGDTGDTGPSSASGRVPRSIWLLSLYGFLAGSAGGAIGRFLPLWAHDVLGLTEVTAGLVVALGGLMGIGSRIAIGRMIQTRPQPARLLPSLAIWGTGYCVVLLAASTIGAWVLWPATILYAIGIAAWNAVAMLAVIRTVPRTMAGRASGIVMLGFLGGLTAGSPVAGAVIDAVGSYQPVWAGSAALLLASALVALPRFTGGTR
jgi:MFS family permease